MGSRRGEVTSVFTRAIAIFEGGVLGSLLRLRLREDGGGVELATASSMSDTVLAGVSEWAVASSLISTVPSWPKAKAEINFELRVFGRVRDRALEDMALKIRVVSCETFEVRISAPTWCLVRVNGVCGSQHPQSQQTTTLF